MRLFFVLISFVVMTSALQAQAKIVEYTVDDAICVEYDPFVVGDICLIYLTQTNGRKVAVLFDFNIMSSREIRSTQPESVYSIDELTGLKVTLDTTYLEPIRSAAVIRELKSDRPEYFYMSSIDNGETLVVIEKE